MERRTRFFSKCPVSDRRECRQLNNGFKVLISSIGSSPRAPNSANGRDSMQQNQFSSYPQEIEHPQYDQRPPGQITLLIFVVITGLIFGWAYI
jgi:hypothetical protein